MFGGDMFVMQKHQMLETLIKKKKKKSFLLMWKNLFFLFFFLQAQVCYVSHPRKRISFFESLSQSLRLCEKPRCVHKLRPLPAQLSDWLLFTGGVWLLQEASI